MQVAYDELHRRATRTCRERRDHTLQPTALVKAPFSWLADLSQHKDLPGAVVLTQHRLEFVDGYCILRAYSSQTGLSSFMNRLNLADPRMGSKHESRAKAG